MPCISPISRADKLLSAVVVCCMIAALAVVSLAAWWLDRAPSPRGEMMSVTRDGRTATFVDCPMCEICARMSSDAKSATVNNSRLKDGDPSPRALEARRAKLLDRVFAAMKEASGAKGVFWGDELAGAWRTNDVPPRVVRRDADGEVLVRGLSASNKAACELAVFSAADESRTFVVDFETLGLAGTVEALDLTERAIPPDMEKKLSALVPAKGVKIYRLVAARAAGKEK